MAIKVVSEWTEFEFEEKYKKVMAEIVGKDGEVEKTTFSTSAVLGQDGSIEVIYTAFIEYLSEDDPSNL